MGAMRHKKESEFNFLLLVAFWQVLCVHTIRRPTYIYRDGMVVVDLGEILVPYIKTRTLKTKQRDDCR